VACLQEYRQGQGGYDCSRRDLLFTFGDFPAIAAFVAIYGLLADPAMLTRNLESLSGLLPGGAIDVIRDQMTGIASHGKTTLGWASVAGLLVSLWSANAGVKSLFDALNLVYNEEEKRGLVRFNLVSLTFTVAGISICDPGRRRRSHNAGNSQPYRSQLDN
jgi:uncharacterized BrkB/YihY/UPF0761 family membrane protein